MILKNRFFHILILVTAISFLVAWLAFLQKGSFAHHEAVYFLHNYLNHDRTWIQKIFDPAINDWTLYQGRELSYVFDAIDAHFVAFTVFLGLPLFYQATHWICLLIIVTSFLVFWSVKKEKTLLSVILSILFLTSPMIALSGNYFRSSKAFLALGLHLILLNHYGESTKFKKNTVYLALSLFIGLLDRQALIWSTFLCIVFWIEKSNKSFIYSLAAGAALAQVYNLWIGPVIIQLVNGYSPDFTYQKINFLDWITQKATFWGSVQLVLDHFRFLTGNTPKWLMSLLFVFLLFTKQRKTWATFIFISIILNSILLFRHNAIGWPDVRRVYYWFPFCVVLMWLLIITLKDYTYKKYLITCVGIVLIGCNIYALRDHRKIFESGNLKGDILAASKIRRCIMSNQVEPWEYDFSVEATELCLFLKKYRSF